MLMAVKLRTHLSADQEAPSHSQAVGEVVNAVGQEVQVPTCLSDMEHMAAPQSKLWTN